MGGCSSKPKTVEFEGALEVQEDKPQTEEAENIGLKGIHKEQESPGRAIETLLTEREHDEVRDMLAETDKQMIAGFSPEANFQEERQVLEDDSQHVKQILAVTVDNLGAEKAPTFKEEVVKLQISPEVVASELHEDPNFDTEVTKTIREAPLCSTLEAETPGTQKGPLVLLKETMEDKEKDVFAESKILSLKDLCISSVEDSSKLQVKMMGLYDGLLELSENLSVGGKEILELQEEPSFNVALGLQEDAHTEASSKGMVEPECHEAVSKNEEQRLNASIGHKGQDNQFGEGSKGCDKLCKETGDVEVVNAASDAVLAHESGEDILKDLSKPRLEDGIKGLVCDEAAEKVIIGTCIITNSPFPEASGQDPSRANDSSDAVQPAITTNVSANCLQHVGDELNLVQEEHEVNVDATFKVAMKDVKLQANNHLMNGFINVETLETTHRDGKLISPKSCMNDEHSVSVSVQLLLENTLGEVQEEKPYAAEGQPKADASCIPDELSASQVIATTKKPEVQSVHMMEFAELALIPVQNIPTPDIDEVWEKLASEFERQESLAHAVS